MFASSPSFDLAQLLFHVLDGQADTVGQRNVRADSEDRPRRLFGRGIGEHGGDAMEARLYNLNTVAQNTGFRPAENLTRKPRTAGLRPRPHRPALATREPAISDNRRGK